MEKRPDPEALLKQIEAEERQAKTGKLKIYLGAAPGVGKTYAMLQDAIAKRKQGLDVVVGIVESHGRIEIEHFLKQLPILPRQIINYHGNALTDFDIDGALARHPGLILIDEMAHTNAPGLRHAKRWQDIKEMLDRGIDVYTTMNVQHIESVSDVVSQIISAPVKETVPDSMLEMAETIELIDLPPEELLRRLDEGKVYIPQQTEWAKTHFFKKGNLTALRELALRITAERVGNQVLLFRQGQGIKRIWAIQEKILVCIGPKSEAQKLIRTAKRMATNLRAKWIAVFVNTPQSQYDEQQRNTAIQNLRLAEQLGAETRVLTGLDVVEEILRFGREQNVTQIIIWKEIRPRWKELFMFNMADKLVRYSGDINIYVVTGNRNITDVATPKKPTKVTWKMYGVALGLLAITTVINLLLFPYVNTYSLIMVYLLAVTSIALFGQTGPALFSAIFSVLLYNFFFEPHFFSDLSISNGQQLLTLTTIILVTYAISHLTFLTQRQADAARFYERQSTALHTLSSQLASTRGIDKLIEIGTKYIGDLFQSDATVYWMQSGHLEIRGKQEHIFTLDEKERGILQWVYDLGQSAGMGTNTLPLSTALYVPLRGAQRILGVLRIEPRTPQLLTSEQIQLLTACTNQLALSLEVDQRQAEMQEEARQLETDRIQNSLLQAVSHDLRTPVASILGTSGTLMDMSDKMDSKKVKHYGEVIFFEAEQLNRLINNLFQIAYLEEEHIKLQKQFNSLPELIQTQLQFFHQKASKRQINLHLPQYVPQIPFDKTLIDAVMFNLIDNAIKFTEAKTQIDITLEMMTPMIMVSVADRGPGIAPDEVDKLFEKFYRGRLLATERGLGLGLAICRKVINAHGGRIWAENRPDGGAIFLFTLPLEVM